VPATVQRDATREPSEPGRCAEHSDVLTERSDLKRPQCPNDDGGSMSEHKDLVAHVKKAAGAVEISEPEGRLALTDRRLFNHLLAHAYPELGRVPTHTIRLSAIRSYAAEARRSGAGENDNRRIKSSVLKLQKTVVEFNYLHSEKGRMWEASPLLSWCSISERTGELTYSFPPQLADKLIEPALFSYISLRVTYQFESKYALILYEVLKRYADRTAETPYWAVKTSELRDLLGCSKKLVDWKDFRRRALDPALAEIAQLAEFAVTIEEVRQGGGRGGGKVVSCIFRVHRKDRQAAEAAARELEKPRVQRRGEKAVRREDAAAGVALRWLSNAEPAVRLRWQKRAEELGVTVPKAASAPENLAKWVPAIAGVICREERLL
jgi:plasmid replication initiation protein